MRSTRFRGAEAGSREKSILVELGWPLPPVRASCRLAPHLRPHTMPEMTRESRVVRSCREANVADRGFGDVLVRPRADKAAHCRPRSRRGALPPSAGCGLPHQVLRCSTWVRSACGRLSRTPLRSLPGPRQASRSPSLIEDDRSPDDPSRCLTAGAPGRVGSRTSGATITAGPTRSLARTQCQRRRLGGP